VTTTGLTGFGKLKAISILSSMIFEIVRRNEQFRGLNIDF